jgi:hypothetical protein
MQQPPGSAVSPAMAATLISLVGVFFSSFFGTHLGTVVYWSLHVGG